MKYHVLIIAVLVIATAFIAGCSQSQPATQQPSGTASSGVIRVGVIASLTGPASNVGTNMWNSAQVAADRINADGGVTLKDGSKHRSSSLSETTNQPSRVARRQRQN